MDVLHDIEAAIIHVYRRRPTLLDCEVDAALEVLIGHYTAEERGRAARSVHLDDARREVYEAVARVCEVHVGRADLPSARLPEAAVRSLGEVVACLKRIRKSVGRITKERGRRGYLEFISSFV